MKVYIAGPMRGIANDNREAFAAATARWRASGHIVFSPAELSCGDEKLGKRDHELMHAIQLDLVCIAHADAIAMLPGWEGSCGATLELAYAQFLGLRVYDAVTAITFEPVRCPWYELKLPAGK